uniref:ABC transporter transmembrane domain-containing protein n=1 Tax=Acetatifactor sp. TaxID=1872090 RepID=UPI004057B432
MRDLFVLVKRLGIQRKYLFLLLLRAPFDAFRTWMLATFMKSTFGYIEIGASDKLLAECMIYGLLCAFLFFYNGTIWSIYAAFAAKTEAQLQGLLINKIMNMPYRRIVGHGSGEWITKLNSDIHGAFVLMNGPLNIPHMVVAIINLMLSSLLLFRSSHLLFIVTLVFVLPHMMLNYTVVLKHMPGLKEASQKALGESTSAIKPLITEADTILLYDAGNMMLHVCEERSRALMKYNLTMQMRNILGNTILRLLGLSGYLVILGLGYVHIYNGNMSFAELVYSFQVRGSILSAMLMLTTCVSNIKANSVCAKRLNNILME